MKLRWTDLSKLVPLSSLLNTIIIMKIKLFLTWFSKHSRIPNNDVQYNFIFFFSFLDFIEKTSILYQKPNSYSIFSGLTWKARYDVALVHTRKEVDDASNCVMCECNKESVFLELVQRQSSYYHILGGWNLQFKLKAPCRMESKFKDFFSQ